MTEKLIEERGNEYGNAWRTTGKLMQRVKDDLHELLRLFPDAYVPWMMILNKLVRILNSPWHQDSWEDIAGYATLVADHIRKSKERQDG